MWSYIKIPNKKPLSQVEMLILTITPDEFNNASEIVDRLDNIMGDHYDASRGTVYPILHRLSDRGFLELKNHSRKSFRRTELGSEFIISLSNTLINQLRSNFLYFETILKEFVNIDSFTSIEMLENFINEINNFKSVTDTLKKYAEDKDKEDGWTDIRIS